MKETCYKCKKEFSKKEKKIAIDILTFWGKVRKLLCTNCHDTGYKL